METLGKRLKNLREKKGMTLKDVAQSIKVRESIVQSLENEEWDKLPQKIFVKGFIRAYIKTVEGNETEILDLFNSAYPYEEAPISCPTFEVEPLSTLGKDRHSLKWIFIPLILILLAGGGYWLITHFSRYSGTLSGGKTTHVETTVVNPSAKKSPVPTPAPPERSENLTTVREQPPAMPPKGAKQSSSGGIPLAENTIPPSSPRAEKPKSGGTSLAATPPMKPEAKTISQKGKATTAPVPSKNNLIITAKMETWVGIKVGGKLKKQLLLRPGDRYATLVKKPVELLIGNAGGIEITYNGKKLGNIGKPGQVVRLTLSPKKDP